MGKMIPPTSPDAPRFDGSPETLLEYLNCVRTLCATANSSEGMLIRYTIACAAQSVPDEALCWQYILDAYQCHSNYRDFIYLILQAYPGVSDDGFFDEITCDDPADTLQISEPIPQTPCADEHDPIEDPATWTYQDRLYALHGPNAALYLSDDCDSCNSEPEIEEVVPFVADLLGLQFEPCDVAPCAPEEEPPLLNFDPAASVPDSLSTSTDKEVLFAFDTDLFGLEFPVDETVGFPSEDPILIDLDFALEDSAPDPMTLCSGLSLLEGLMFDAPPEVPRYPPGLSHIPQARIRSHSLSLIDVASDMTLPSLGLMFDIDAYDAPCEDLCSGAFPTLPALIRTPCDFLDSACDDLPSGTTLIMQSSDPVIRNALDSQCEDLCSFAHPVLVAVAPIAPPHPRMRRTTRRTKPHMSGTHSHCCTHAPDRIWTHSCPPWTTVAIILRRCTRRRHCHSLFPIQQPGRRRLGSHLIRRRRKRRWYKRRRRRPRPDDPTFPPPFPLYLTPSPSFA
jgi:hypothetical protein